jgi:hypothetical protein
MVTSVPWQLRSAEHNVARDAATQGTASGDPHVTVES